MHTPLLNLRSHALGLGLGIALAIYLFNAGSSGYDVKEIDVATARQLREAGAVFIDVRTSDAFGNRHIAEARTIPLEQLRAAIPADLAADKAKPLVIYCGDGVTTGPEGTHILNQAGFANAVNLKGGLDSWEKAGLPTVRKAAS